MTRKNYLFTSESVSEGHPDKVCDRISDEIVDAFFREGAKAGVDPYVDSRRLRDALHHQPRRHRRRSARARISLRAHRGRRPQGDQGHRLRAGRLPLEARQGRSAAARTVRRHRPRRRRRRQQGRRRGRPGHHVRLRRARDARSDAGAALLFPQDSAKRSPQARHSGKEKRARPRRQEPGHAALRRRQAGRGDADRALALSMSTRA